MPEHELEALSPVEVAVASHAVAAQRETTAALELLEGLTDRERLLARCAWTRAREDVLRTVRELIGPAAATVDAAYLRERLLTVEVAPMFRRVEHGPDERELELARDVRELLPMAEGLLS
jgi:hypothetical protein